MVSLSLSMSLLMRRLVFFCHILLLLISGQSVTAEVFIVTTTADSGPGSFRDAIEKAAANGDRDTDYIHFNITRARDNFIRVPLSNLLPALTSNLVIDGTTQPGAAFGVTQAKVGIALEGFYSGTNELFGLDVRQARDVKIYGIFFRSNVLDRATLQPPTQLFGLVLGGSTDVEVGQPGKGNLISGWSYGIYDVSQNRWGNSARITIRSNIFGLDIDGVSTQYQDRTGGTATNTNSIVFEKSSRNNQVGGAAPNEGNIFNSSAIDILLQGTLVSDGLVTISNNQFGLDVNGNNLSSTTGIGIRVLDINTFPGNPFLPATPVINYNYFAGKNRAFGILATNVKTNFLIHDNTLGFEDRNGQPPRDPYFGTAIAIRSSEQAAIRNNIIRYWRSGAILMDTTYSITITGNSTYCNRMRAISLNHWNVMNPAQRPMPFAYINTIAGVRSTVSGTAVPRSKVELFYNENCQNCEGKTWFATVQADLNGDWQYSGPLTSDNIVATATDVGGATSEYSMPKIDVTSVKIGGASCGDSLGSICGLKILSGTNWHWEDTKGNNLGSDTCLFNLPTGWYVLKLAIGSSCEEGFPFFVPDSTPTIDVSHIVKFDARCGGPYGYICGISVTNPVSVAWEDEFGNVVSNKLCMNDAYPGKYRLKVEGLRNCDAVSPYFEIKNITPRIDITNLQLIQPSCEKNNGSITGLQVFDTAFSKMGWYNENGILVSANKDLLNAPPGKYKFIVKDVSGICGDSTTFYVLNKLPGMQVDTANIQLVHATCGNSNGGITGISVIDAVGGVNYQWVDAQKNIVATTIDLLNAPPGSYQLKIKDGSNCDTLVSSFYTIVNQGNIVVDGSNVTISAAGCTKNKGAITGLQITGATNFEWLSVPGSVVVGSSMDLINVPAGKYQLRAINLNYGCTITSSTFEINTGSPLTVNLSSDIVQDARCAQNNGSIQLTIGNASAFNFNWLKDSVVNISSALSINGLSPGAYYCIATDTNGCTQNFYKRNIVALPLPTLNQSGAVIKDDTCALSTGSITGFSALSDQPGLKYEWLNGSGQLVSNQLQLLQAVAGEYQLKLTDSRGCVVNSNRYNISLVTVTLSSPAYAVTKIEIPRNADANLKVQLARPGQYDLMDVSTGNIIQQNNTGDFSINNVSADMSLQVRYSAGPCSSGITHINIKVFDDTRLNIPNAFSPNNDGINDVFKIKVEGYFLMKYLRIYNRWGQLMYESRDVNLGWDGRKTGSDLPVGTYYWILEGIDVNNRRINRSGSVTLLR